MLIRKKKYGVDLDLDALEEEGGQDEFTPTKVDAAADKPSAPLPPVPQVTGCRTQGQIAVTFASRDDELERIYISRKYH